MKRNKFYYVQTAKVVNSRNKKFRGKEFLSIFQILISIYMSLSPWIWLIFNAFNSFGFMDFVLVSSFVFILDIYVSHKKLLLIISNAEKICCDFSYKNLF